MEEKEVWKDVVGYEGLYQVSDLGRVKSLDRKVKSGFGSERTVRGIILKDTDNRGHRKVILYKMARQSNHSLSP